MLTHFASFLMLSAVLHAVPAADVHARQVQQQDKPAPSEGARQGGAGIGLGPATDATPAPGGAKAPMAYAARDVTTKAVIRYKPEPAYTEEARRNNVSGTVMLRAILASTGEVTGIVPVQRLPFGLTERAIEAARAIKFIPATKDGKPASQYVRIDYNFNLFDYDELAEKIVEAVPYLSAEAQPLLSRLLAQSKATPQTAGVVFWQRLGAGFSKLSLNEQMEFQKLRVKSLSVLTQEELDELERINAKETRTIEESVRTMELMKKAARSLPEAELGRMRELSLKAMRAGAEVSDPK